MSSLRTIQPFGNHFPKVHVYAATDVSGSMAGHKCSEVWEELRNLLSKCPDDVTFNIILFTSRAWSMVSSTTTKNIDIAGLISQIEGRWGGQTALYDAWGDLLLSIPRSGETPYL